MDLDEHYLTRNEVTKTYDCSQCPWRFLKMDQLKQHMLFHTVATSSKESTASKRKTVHIKTTLESRDVDDNFLNKEGSEDEVDYNSSNRVTKTRSGRIVKRPIFFQIEASVKRKKNFNKVRTKAKKVEQTVVLNTANAVIGKPLVTPSCPTNGSVTSKKLDKELRVLREKIPERISKINMAKGNVCIRDIYENQESANANLPSNCQTLTLNNKVNGNESKVLKVMSKSNIGTVASANSKQNKPPEDILNNETMSGGIKLGGKFHYMHNSFTNTYINILPVTSNSSDNEGNSSDDKKQGNSNESGISIFEVKDGILEAKVVDDSIVLNITPELMQKLQRENMDLQHKYYETIVISNPVTPTYETIDISEPVTSSLNKDLYSNSIECVDLTLSDDSNSSDSVIEIGQHRSPEGEAIQKAYEISLKFERTLSEKECLNLLDQLDNLVTKFNISDKCPFIYAVIRFCKVYVESHEVKERAISLHTKITKSKM